MYCNEPVQESGHQYVGAVLMNAREWGLEIYEPGQYIVADRKRDENADIPPPPNVKTVCAPTNSPKAMEGTRPTVVLSGVRLPGFCEEPTEDTEQL